MFNAHIRTRSLFLLSRALSARAARRFIDRINNENLTLGDIFDEIKRRHNLT